MIVVLNDTRISPPYNSDSITGNPKTVEMIKSRVVSEGVKSEKWGWQSL